VITSLEIFFAAMFLHELGHTSMALVFGVKVYRIGLCWYGMFTEMDLPSNRAEFFFVTLAGPVTTIAFFLLGCIEGWNQFSLANVCILLGCFLPGGDFVRLFQYSGLQTKARIRMRLSEVAR
jgi:Zn-dependent protease